MAHGHDTWDMSANLEDYRASRGECLEHHRNIRAEISTVEIRVCVPVMHSAAIWYVCGVVWAPRGGHGGCGYVTVSRYTVCALHWVCARGYVVV